MSDREDFVNSWLIEMPSGTGKASSEMYNPLNYAIKDRIAYGSTPVSLSNGFKKIIGQTTAFYWHETAAGMIDIAVELTVTPHTFIVTGVGKHPKGSSVYATDLYTTILNDTNKAIRLVSDNLLSDQGLDIWKRLLQQGHAISVYDKQNPNQGLLSIRTDDELMQYFKLHSNDYQRYQYVLTEMGESLAEVRSIFNTRQMRYLAGLL